MLARNNLVAKISRWEKKRFFSFFESRKNNNASNRDIFFSPRRLNSYHDSNNHKILLLLWETLSSEVGYPRRSAKGRNLLFPPNQPSCLLLCCRSFACLGWSCSAGLSTLPSVISSRAGRPNFLRRAGRWSLVYWRIIQLPWRYRLLLRLRLWISSVDGCFSSLKG